MKKIFKILFSIMLLTAFIVPHFVQAGILADFEAIISDYYWIDVSKFTYIDPNQNDFFGALYPKKDTKALAQIKTWSENDNPHFRIKGSSEKAAQKIITDSLYGMSIFRIKALKDTHSFYASQPTNTTMLDEIKKILEDNNCTDTISNVAEIVSYFPNAAADHVLAMNTNYTYYNCYDTLYQYAQKKQNKAILTEDVVFVAGMGNVKKDGISQKTVDEYNKYFSKPVSTKGVNYVFNTAQTKEVMSDTLAKSATGACYEIMPKGTNNNCTTTIQSTCNPSKKSNIYFLAGISCTTLNPLFYDQSSSAANIVTAGGAALKDKMNIQFQVPFGDVKDGISLADYINAIYKYLVAAGLVLAGIMFSLGGFQYLIGRPKEGMNLIKQSSLGLVLLVSAYTVLNIINPNTTNLNALEVTEIGRDASVSSSSLTPVDIDTPSTWKAVSGAEDPFNFKLAPPPSSVMDTAPKEKVWNTHYYTLYYSGSKTKQGIYQYPIIDSNNKVILWTNTNAWCATAMEGSGIFMVEKEIIPVNVVKAKCGFENARPGWPAVTRTAADKTNADAVWKGSMDQTIENNTCTTKIPPVKQAGGVTPTCSWWYTHTNSLWQTFAIKSKKKFFGGAGATGGSLIPLRSIATISSFSSTLKKHIAKYGYGKNNLLIYIPDAAGKQLKAPSGEMITHDGYFWVSDHGGLTGKAKSSVKDTDGQKTTVTSSQQIDMFTGTIKQNILDGNLHEVYIIDCNKEPGKNICEKFYAQQMNGYPNVQVK